MRQLARCIAALLLAFLGSSCLATGAVVEWAWEPEVRTEVLGYVESNVGASLIVTLDDASKFEDGVYEVPVVPSDEKHAPESAPASFVARRLGEGELAEFLHARGASRRVGRLQGTSPYSAEWSEHVDVFQRTAAGLRRVGPEGPRTTVALLPQWDSSPESKSSAAARALVVVQRKGPGRKPTRVIGVAAVPPAGLRLWRTVPAVLALPGTFALDVVTFPVQAVLVLHWIGEGMSKIGEAFAQALWMHFSVLPIVFGPKLFESGRPAEGMLLPFSTHDISTPVPAIIAAGVQWQWQMLWGLYLSAKAHANASSPGS